MMLMMAFAICVFVMIGVPFAQISNTYSVNGADNMAISNSTAYEAQLDNIASTAKNGTQTQLI